MVLKRKANISRANNRDYS